MSSDQGGRHGTLKPKVAGEPEGRPHPTGTNAPERIPPAERDRLRTDQYVGDGRDPSFHEAAADGHEMVATTGQVAAHLPKS